MRRAHTLHSPEFTSIRETTPSALANLNQALPLAKAVNDPLILSPILYGMMRVHKAQPALAIFYGKQAVNLAATGSQQYAGPGQGTAIDLCCVKGGLLSRSRRSADCAGPAAGSATSPGFAEAAGILGLCARRGNGLRSVR